MKTLTGLLLYSISTTLSHAACPHEGVTNLWSNSKTWDNGVVSRNILILVTFTAIKCDLSSKQFRFLEIMQISLLPNLFSWKVTPPDWAQLSSKTVVNSSSVLTTMSHWPPIQFTFKMKAGWTLVPRTVRIREKLLSPWPEFAPERGTIHNPEKTNL